MPLGPVRTEFWLQVNTENGSVSATPISRGWGILHAFRVFRPASESLNTIGSTLNKALLTYQEKDESAQKLLTHAATIYKVKRAHHEVKWLVKYDTNILIKCVHHAAKFFSAIIKALGGKTDPYAQLQHAPALNLPSWSDKNKDFLKQVDDLVDEIEKDCIKAIKLSKIEPRRLVIDVSDAMREAETRFTQHLDTAINKGLKDRLAAEWSTIIGNDRYDGDDGYPLWVLPRELNEELKQQIVGKIPTNFFALSEDDQQKELIRAVREAVKNSYERTEPKGEKYKAIERWIIDKQLKECLEAEWPTIIGDGWQRYDGDDAYPLWVLPRTLNEELKRRIVEKVPHKHNFNALSAHTQQNELIRAVREAVKELYAQTEPEGEKYKAIERWITEHGQVKKA